MWTEEQSRVACLPFGLPGTVSNWCNGLHTKPPSRRLNVRPHLNGVLALQSEKRPDKTNKMTHRLGQLGTSIAFDMRRSGMIEADHVFRLDMARSPAIPLTAKTMLFLGSYFVAKE